MRLIGFFVTSLILCFFLYPTKLKAGEFDGKWIGKIKDSTSSCKKIGKDLQDQYVVYIKHGKEKTITMTVEFTGNIFQGVQQTANPNLIHLRASFLEDAGIVTENVNLEMADNRSGKGGGVWTWSDGLMTCGGSFNFTLKKVSD